MSESLKFMKSRPAGISSRIRKVRGPRSIRVAENGLEVELPVIVDHLNMATNGDLVWLVEARVELVHEKPEITRVNLAGNPNLDPIYLQRFFRWATPLEVVRILLPDMIARGLDPYNQDLPQDLPEQYAHDRDGIARQELSEEFLREVSRQYLEIGRGYSARIAEQRGVSSRTVVSWIEKARQRGILSATRQGKHGGELSRPPSER